MFRYIPKIPTWLFKTLPGQIRQQGWPSVISYYATRLGATTRGTHNAIRKIKIAARPAVYLHRRSLIASPTLKIPKDKGWLRAPDGYFDGTAELIAHCEAMFRKHEQEIRNDKSPVYGFAIRIQSGLNGPILEDPEELRPILTFCSQPKVFDTVADYVGERPVIAGLSLIYTEINEFKIGSQKFHRDMNDENQIHMVIPIWPIDDDTGPFTLLPADESAKVIKALGHDGGRVEDEDMFKHTSPDNLVRLTGKPGTVYFANPYKCFHFGARSRKKPRYMLIVNFPSLFGIDTALSVHRADNRHVLSTQDERLRALIDL